MTKWVQRNDLLAHQIRLFFSRPPGDSTMKVAVSCNCKPGNRPDSFLPMGYIQGEESPWAIFNDPDNHDDHREPFVPNGVALGVPKQKSEPIVVDNIYPLREVGGSRG